MTPRALVAALGVAVAGVAVAQTPTETSLLPDRSASARLVLAHWPAEGWSVRQDGRVAEIRFPGAALDIDLAAARDAVGPEVLRGISAERGSAGTVLRLDLGCACGVAVSGDGEARVAIDIVGAGLPAGPALRARAVAPARAPSPPPRGKPGSSESAATPADSRDPTLAEARDRLVEQLERAAAAGLVRLREDLPARSEVREERGAAAPAVAAPAVAAPASVQPRPAPATSPTAPARERAAPVAPGGPAAGPEPAEEAPDRRPGASRPEAALRPLDRGAAERGETPVALVSGEPACVSDERIALPDPAPGPAALERLAELRGRLLGEFDRPDTEVAVDLARGYLALGLGYEAREVLGAFAPDHPDTPPLATVGLALESAPVPEGHALSSAGCGGAHALWRALAGLAGDWEPHAIADALRSAGSLEAMPEPRRTRLALRLGLAAAETGDRDLAKAFRAIARHGDRADRQPLAARLLLDGLIARWDDDREAALSHLRRAWGRGGRHGALAMLALADMVRVGELPEETDTHLLRLDLAGVARAARDTPLAARAATAEADLAFSALGRNAALELLGRAREEGILSEEEESRALIAIADRPDPGVGATPLALLFDRHPSRYAAALSEPAFRAAVARSYAEIGLPARGEAILEPDDLRDPALAGALARAHLEADEPRAAARLARRLPDGAARAEIEAAALAGLGDAPRALARLREAEAGTPRQRARLAWRAGDWPAAAAALERALVDDPDPATAVRLALALRRSGGAPVSDEARRAVAALDPDLLETVGGLSDPAGPPETPATAEAMREFLGPLGAETATMKEVLADG
jgi:hypothetical protein